MLVAVDAAFAAAAEDRVRTTDGVNLTPFGHAALAQHWLRAVTPRT